MYVKSMVLEGFKSYGKRIEINGFDKEFNAITGLNGSGKSNILDAICFVLGITNLGQVRATSLQELVYKSGQAGIKKATVTIVFDNSDRSSSPLGYEQFEEITIARQVVIGGKNKYMINGFSVPNKRVHDMFCSVQLNVNNPHFLIMQGRITKVLNMKPIEILSMIEEAAGTSMYETKKQNALKTIEKKDSKLKEINDVLREEIGPKLARLKEEKMQYVEFQRIERELEHCKRIYIAWKYVQAQKKSAEAEKNVETVKEKISELKKCIIDGETEVTSIEKEIEDITNERDAEMGGQLESLEHEVKEAEKKEHKLKATFNSNKESIDAQEKNIEHLKANIQSDEKLLEAKEAEINKVGGLFQTLKENEQKDSETLAVAQEAYEKISAGFLQTDTGENATLEQQIINAKQNAAQAQTEIKQCEMGLTHNEELLKKKMKDMLNTENEYKQDNKNLEERVKELKNLENNLKKLNYEDGYLESLKEQRQRLTKDIREIQDKVDYFESNYPQLRFHYQKPEPNFREQSVKGLVCKLISVKDKKAAYALDVAAGGKLYNVIVDTENTSKLILQKGQLQRRVTIIPLNKIRGQTIGQETVALAQNLVGKENVQPALSLIEFPEETRPAMTWIFGQIFICKDMNTAKRIAFHNKIMKKCITLEGDVFDPAGILSGGAMSKGGSILLKLDELKSMENELSKKTHTLNEITQKMSSINETAQKYASLKKLFDLKSYEVDMVKQKLQQTTHYQIKQEVETLNATIAELKEKMTVAKKKEAEHSKRAKVLESQLKDAANIREKQLKEAEQNLKTLKKKAEESKKEWQKRQQEAETLTLEVKDLQDAIKTGNEELAKAEEKLEKLREEGTYLMEKLDEANSVVKQSHSQLKAHKDNINKRNKKIQNLIAKKEEIAKQRSDFLLEIQKLNHEINAIKNDAVECKHKLTDMIKKHEWIEQDEKYFGQSGGTYDFQANDPEQMGHKMRQLESVHERMSKNVNTRSINLLNKEEELYNETLKKKKIVEADKKKILLTIKHLDEKKRETLLKACEQVNRDFGSIFSTLLPGACAKLQPPENQSVIDGVEVKIGFSGVWKESLGELSGGQRSLVALSLILAMLLFKPAPLYILDEVDAALDISHTENIGTMLKQHFKHSQFIVVSLKDGMFNNANVLFTTKFVDGMSTVSRKSKH